MADQTSSNQSNHACRSNLYSETIQRLDKALHCLDQTIHNTPNQSNRDRLVSIRDEITRMIEIVRSYNPYCDIGIQQFYASLSTSVTGNEKWSSISSKVSLGMVHSMFPFYMGRDRVRAYLVTRCTDPIVGPLIYSRWLAAHHRWPHNDELPLYFCKQLYAEVHLHLDVDYTSIPRHAGHGKGRLADKAQYRRQDLPPPIDKRKLVGPNLLFLLKHLKFGETTESTHTPSSCGIFKSIATIANQVDQLTSDTLSRYTLHHQFSVPPTEATSNNYDPSIRANIVSPHDVAQMTGVDELRRLYICLSRDLIDAYRFISEEFGIPLDAVKTHIRRYSDRQRGLGQATTQCSRGHEDVQVDSIAPPKHVSDQV
ncbi:uncharacterized protein LOC131043295 [Cryptomeria japonica]|uniref:uncharacterized protein LOC131043295 n=1 Tax=Cryptomeria japonica TaxID=3369 RepID=UPI0027D9EF4D|nr:uncharacterized protein LOC131043295 [Cryptomeria japonica]